jgi:hypothetical protein
MSGTLMLKTVTRDMQAYGYFLWPREGRVECPDWNPKPICGGGLHGLPEGVGDGQLLDWSADAVWLVFEADQVVAIDTAKAKTNRANVVHCGDRLSATRYLIDHGCHGPVVGATITAGDAGTATAGDRGTATAGNAGTATAGDAGTATAGYAGTATAGDRGTATAGDAGTATAGYAGTATAGDAGTATAGDRGTATAGYAGTATAGDAGTVIVKWLDGTRYRLAIGYVGENGIKPGVPYIVRDGALVPAEGGR